MTELGHSEHIQQKWEPVLQRVAGSKMRKQKNSSVQAQFYTA